MVWLSRPFENQTGKRMEKDHLITGYKYVCKSNGSIILMYGFQRSLYLNCYGYSDCNCTLGSQTCLELNGYCISDLILH
jgi:hypothetical protein